MISAIRGSVVTINPNSIDICVDNTGLVLQIMVPTVAEFTLNKPAMVHTYLHWNQENGPSLYGFSSQVHREIFSIVLACNGVGPKMGLALLQELSPAQLVEAVAQQDIKALSRVSGIGPKKAEHIILQLRGKVDKITKFQGVQLFGAAQHLNNVSDVLMSLNYSRSEVMNAITYVREQNNGNANFDELMRKALAFLSKKV